MPQLRQLHGLFLKRPVPFINVSFRGSGQSLLPAFLPGVRTAVVVTLTDRETLPQIKKACVGARLPRPKGGETPPLLLEIRIDRFRKLDEAYIREKIRKLRQTKLPLIATIRSAKEGGGRTLSDAKRTSLFQAAFPLINAIDLELSSPQLVRTLIPLARRKKKTVILSYHNFKSTPSEHTMRNLLQTGIRRGADLVKIAVTPKKPGDVARLLHFTHQNREQGLITIAMGRLGKPSRVLGPLFGSRLTYTFIGKPQAPGQLSLGDLLKQITFISTKKSP